MEAVDYGVCRLSLVPVRKEPVDTAEQVTQLLFGDHYEVTERSENGKWLKIKIYADQYTGWLDANQHHSITPEYFEHINTAGFKITTDITSTLLYNKSTLVILMGSIIPISGAELFRMEEQFAFNCEAKNLGQKREFEFLKATALKYLNAPYQWGGKSPFGIDCSGFTQMVFRIAGFRLWRDAAQQAGQGREVPSLSEALPGDLAFFRNQEGKITHTGILLGNNKIIHASGKVRIDNIDEEGILKADTNLYTHKLSHLRRLLPD